MTDAEVVAARRAEVDAELADDERRRHLEHAEWCNETYGCGRCDCGIGYPTPAADPVFHPVMPSAFDGIARSVYGR